MTDPKAVEQALQALTRTTEAKSERELELIARLTEGLMVSQADLINQVDRAILHYSQDRKNLYDKLINLADIIGVPVPVGYERPDPTPPIPRGVQPLPHQANGYDPADLERAISDYRQSDTSEIVESPYIPRSRD